MDCSTLEGTHKCGCTEQGRLPLSEKTMPEPKDRDAVRRGWEGAQEWLQLWWVARRSGRDEESMRPDDLGAVKARPRWA